MRVGNDEKKTAEAEGRENPDWCALSLLEPQQCQEKASVLLLTVIL